MRPVVRANSMCLRLTMAVCCYWSIASDHLDSAELETRTLVGHTEAVMSVEFSPNGEMLMSADSNGKIILWNRRDWSILQTISLDTDDVNCVRFSGDGRKLAAACDDGVVKVWDIAQKKVLVTIQQKDSFGEKDSIGFVRWSPNSEFLLTASNKFFTYPAVLKLWDANTGKHVRDFEGRTMAEDAVFSKSGSELIASRIRSIEFLDVATGKRTHEMRQFSEPSYLELSPDGKQLIVSAYYSVELVDVTKKKRVRSIARVKDHGIDVNDEAYARAEDEISKLYFRAIARSNDFRLVCAARRNGELSVWRVRDSKLLSTIKIHKDVITSLAWSSDGKYLASAGWARKGELIPELFVTDMGQLLSNQLKQ
jgi:WD40 repeat protein